MSDTQRSQVEIRVAATPDEDTSVVVDGVNMTDRIRQFTITAGVRQLTTLHLEYACREGASFEGGAQVVHRCGLESDDA